MQSNYSEELKTYPDFLAELLFHRGLDNSAKAESFLNPDYENHMHDPFLMKDMEKAVSRVLDAISKNEKVIIFGDYDTDGIPASVIFHDFFKKVGFQNFKNYIPHRHNEGFGLNKSAIEEFAKDETKLLITLDCGVADVEEVDLANKLGVEVIITDHHLVTQKGLPKAYAILNPKQDDCNYPEKMLCGAGVGFKFIQALIKRGNFDIKDGWEKWLLDMVGIATLSDMVPLQGENRVFAYYGLKVLRKSPRPGLMKLFRKLNVNPKNINEDDVGFTISPRINAASRMGSPQDAFNMLSTVDEVEAGNFVEHLNKINDERKGIVASLIKEIKKKINERNPEEKKKIIVIGNPNWKPSLLGLVCGNIIEEHSCPVFLWGRDGDGVLKGSCRSDGSISLVELMNKVPKEIFEDFGGHHLAGGFTVSNEGVHFLEDEIEKAYESMDKNQNDFNTVFIDRKLSLDDVNWDTYSFIEKLAPYGVGNPKPVFLFENVSICGVKKFGKQGNHLELTFENKNRKKIPAIIFFMADSPSFCDLKIGDKINLVASLEKSLFRNFPELRLRIIDTI